MAKVTGPLFSITASGQIAKSLVYITWKGIQDVRKYVIPANPKSTDQQTQRNYMKAAVLEWQTDGFTAVDKTAWNLYASTLKTVMSGFNACIALKVAAKILVYAWTKLTDLSINTITSSGCNILVSVASDKSGRLFYGTSKSAMTTEVVGTFNAGTYTFILSGLTASTRYFCYIKNVVASESARTGIFSWATIAA